MKQIGITMRVDYHEKVDEKRDAIDQRWYKFLNACQLYPIPIPNFMAGLDCLLTQNWAGFILTGGNSPESLGGDAPERDQIEQALMELAVKNSIPVLGVCRGMQVIQHYFGVNLIPVTEHVAVRHTFHYRGSVVDVNSYHHFGALDSVPSLVVDGRSEDGVIEAISHQSLPIKGIMWHPEREDTFSAVDIELFKSHFC
ncbi:hypothetical protein DIZ81_09690 [Legionella taurinensis]|uniref:Glutamine amidotransferase n=1 Tax=Legionella taurinensis TaxID=70611 RepID=A0AB38N6E8_9GAMM|nr:gamma-glutamyl-gamma-aminobutyrate hydrolase family protein [Legionella taurinensis]MDX1838006.1 gamma-glutamyl-gamma-aminobutyrate hydrolase family protein [Legionella taurinensis]PUT39406.1 hypothetical protein DB744_09700 [Legionella taurinensis]PUT41715.1 hypothetical protein DB746_08615 [Legionella taurinensis]PUT44549.1 hypothetical protein DB743_07830 [Legionella taurinensis]PUT46793.1 hypothetical protein DB745_09695 [Legionella taurinensis]